MLVLLVVTAGSDKTLGSRTCAQRDREREKPLQPCSRFLCWLCVTHSLCQHCNLKTDSYLWKYMCVGFMVVTTGSNQALVSTKVCCLWRFVSKGPRAFWLRVTLFVKTQGEKCVHLKSGCHSWQEKEEKKKKPPPHPPPQKKRKNSVCCSVNNSH